MWPDQWLIQQVAKWVFWRYGSALQGEAHKWAALIEANRLQQLKGELATCGQDVTLREGVQLIRPERIRIGKHVAIGYYSVLQGAGGITLDDFVLLGDHVILATSSHPSAELHFHNFWSKPIHLQENVWLGSNVVVLPGVTIGQNSAIGAGAVVTKDIPPDSVALGVPARVVETLQFDPDQLTEQKRATRELRLKRIGLLAEE
jgi:acetyltransferase-like isoleucine patch superfamily enzyme